MSALHKRNGTIRKDSAAICLGGMASSSGFGWSNPSLRNGYLTTIGQGSRGQGFVGDGIGLSRFGGLLAAVKVRTSASENIANNILFMGFFLVFKRCGHRGFTCKPFRTTRPLRSGSQNWKPQSRRKEERWYPTDDAPPSSATQITRAVRKAEKQPRPRTPLLVLDPLVHRAGAAVSRPRW